MKGEGEETPLPLAPTKGVLMLTQTRAAKTGPARCWCSAYHLHSYVDAKTAHTHFSAVASWNLRRCGLL